MSALTITHVELASNPTALEADIVMDVMFETFQRIESGLSFQLLYVGSADDVSKDQILDTVEMKPLDKGNYQFRLVSPGPNPSLIPKEDVRGVTVLLFSGLLNGKEFIRYGYYVNVDYRSEALAMVYKDQPHCYRDMDKTILDKDPIVSKFAIGWNTNK